jgi:hypothetical protein
MKNPDKMSENELRLEVNALRWFIGGVIGGIESSFPETAALIKDRFEELEESL